MRYRPVCCKSVLSTTSIALQLQRPHYTSKLGRPTTKSKQLQVNALENAKCSTLSNKMAILTPKTSGVEQKTFLIAKQFCKGTRLGMSLLSEEQCSIKRILILDSNASHQLSCFSLYLDHLRHHFGSRKS